MLIQVHKHHYVEADDVIGLDYTNDGFESAIMIRQCNGGFTCIPAKEEEDLNRIAKIIENAKKVSKNSRRISNHIIPD